MEWASNGSHGRMRILERDADETVLLTPAPTQSMPPISAPVVAQAKRTHALPRPFEARLVVDGRQFAMRAEPMGGVGQYRLRIWAGTSDGEWRLIEKGLGVPITEALWRKSSMVSNSGTMRSRPPGFSPGRKMFTWPSAALAT